MPRCHPGARSGSLMRRKPSMMKKTYGSLPKLYDLGRRVRVRAALSMESSSIRVSPDLLDGVASARERGDRAAAGSDRSRGEAPRLRKALQESSAQHLVETMIEGLLQLSSKEIEGFSICPLV